MPDELKITVGELARLALGAPLLRSAHIALLHHLVAVVLRRLNCEHETVTISGVESASVRRLFERTTPLCPAICVDAVQPLQDNSAHMFDLEQRCVEFACRLRCHIEEGVRSRTTDFHFDLRQWQDLLDRYSGEAYDECSERDGIACALLQQEFFLKKLQRRVAVRIRSRYCQVGEKLLRLDEKLAIFKRTLMAQFAEVYALVQSFADFEPLDVCLSLQEDNLLDAAETAQESLDEKYAKVFVPALKNFVMGQLKLMWRKYRQVARGYKQCPEPRDDLAKNVQCAVCGRRVCTFRRAIAVGLLPELHVSFGGLLSDVCEQEAEVGPEDKLPARWEYTNLELETEGAKINRQLSRCRRDESPLLTGTDGRLYRKG